MVRTGYRLGAVRPRRRGIPGSDGGAAACADEGGGEGGPDGRPRATLRDCVVLSAAVTAVCALGYSAGSSAGDFGQGAVGVIALTVVVAGAVAVCWFRFRRVIGAERDFWSRSTRLVRIAIRIVEEGESGLPIVGTLQAAAEVLRLPNIQVKLYFRTGSRLSGSAYAQYTDRPTVVSVRHGGRNHGRVIAHAGPGSRIGRAELELLAAFATELGAACSRRSRHCLGTVRKRNRGTEAEKDKVRHQIQRDLHDGLAPVLAAVKMQIDSVRTLLDTDTRAAAGLLERVGADTQMAVTDVRRLVRELRAPTVAALVPALREQATRFQRATNDGLRVRIVVDAEEELSWVPDDVASAAYLIATEALNNTVKHAQAKCCTITVAATDERLRVEIVDDGIGISVHQVTGLGLWSMRERAREFGGECRISPVIPSGTRIAVSLLL